MNKTFHNVRLSNYKVEPSGLVLGTVGSNNTEVIKVERGYGWEDCSIEVTIRTPKAVIDSRMLPVNDEYNVPSIAVVEAATLKEPGLITFRGLDDSGDEIIERISVSIKYTVLERGPVGGDIIPDPPRTVLDDIIASERKRQEDTEKALQDVSDAISDIKQRADDGEFDGPAGTIKIEKVITGEPGTDAHVENIGTESDAVLIITIPRGEDGKADYEEVVNIVIKYLEEHPVEYDDSELREAIKQLGIGLSTKSDADSVYNKEEIDQKLADAGKVKSVNGMTGDVTIDLPSKLSELDNDTGFIDKSVSDLDNYYDKETVDGIVGGIEELVPEQASAENQLADKDYVNSSIATNTAYYISKDGEPFSSLDELKAYSGELTNNDYAFVIGNDATGNTVYTRYKYNADTEEWAKEFDLNNSSFTAAQWSAINSGITALLVLSMSAHIDDGDIHVTSQQKAAWNAKSDFSGSYTDLTDKPSIPEKVSELDNDSEFITDEGVVFVDESEDPEEVVHAVTSDEFDLEIGNIKEDMVSKSAIDPATGDMTQPVGITADGKLVTAPGGSSSWSMLADLTLTEDASIVRVDFDKPYQQILILMTARSNNEENSLTSGYAIGSIAFGLEYACYDNISVNSPTLWTIFNASFWASGDTTNGVLIDGSAIVRASNNRVATRLVAQSNLPNYAIIRNHTNLFKSGSKFKILGR